jgi:putative Holliday junction resolvase
VAAASVFILPHRGGAAVKDEGRILAVDPGDQRIGLAISDPTGTIASPLLVVKHVARMIDAATIAQIALDQGAVKIVVGQAMDMDGNPSPQGRKSARLAEAISSQTNLPVELWDESGSTAEARASRLAMGVRRSRRGGHLDEIAATVILQSYLEAHSSL